jgi:hypothetical protein
VHGTEFTIAVSDWASSSRQPLTVAIYFCGAVRAGLHLRELNSVGDLDLKEIRNSHIEMDSVLGPHEDCRYVIAKGGLGPQVIIAGSSRYEAKVQAAAGVSLIFPGVTSILTPEPLESQTARPISRSSTIDVAIDNPPADFRISAARPQIPESGELSWKNGSLLNLPTQYQVSGSLQGQEALGQSQLFFAGALAGVAGAALLWGVELVFDLGGRRDYRPKSRRRAAAASPPTVP